MAYQQERRATDTKEQHDIERLIEQENDPKVRLHLMVMNRINLSLIANTETINTVARDVTNVAAALNNHLTHFEEHTKAEEAMVNKGKGVWMVMAKIIGGVQLIGLGIWAYASSEISDIHTSLHVFEQADTILDKRITIIESKVK